MEPRVPEASSPGPAGKRDDVAAGLLRRDRTGCVSSYREDRRDPVRSCIRAAASGRTVSAWPSHGGVVWDCTGSCGATTARIRTCRSACSAAGSALRTLCGVCSDAAVLADRRSPRLSGLRVPETLRASRDLLMLVEQSTEPVVPLDGVRMARRPLGGVVAAERPGRASSVAGGYVADDGVLRPPYVDVTVAMNRSR